jgi:hypothetical protein
MDAWRIDTAIDRDLRYRLVKIRPWRFGFKNFPKFIGRRVEYAAALIRRGERDRDVGDQIAAP